MKKSTTGMLMGVLSLGCALVAQAADMGDAEKAVAAEEQKYAQAQRENKTERESSQMADKFFAVDPNGTVIDRAQGIASEKATKYTTVNIEDMHVTAYGDTAIASVLQQLKGTDDKGKPFDAHLRFTDTWVKMPDGKWQIVASHGSVVKK